MAMPLLTTKLYIPPVRRDPSTGLKPVGSTGRTSVVPRPRLIERMEKGIHRKLTLVSAPAGFGKTTLVSEWVHAMGKGPSPMAAAWLSLDEGDNDPTRFLAYLVAALQTLALSADGTSGVEGVAANIGAGLLGLLHTSGPQPPPIESILTTLINEIAAIPDNFVLVLDDYHVIDAEPVDNALTFLLEHLPPQMHLVIATREDPHLPLARLRARGQLAELRITDLRFTPTEAATFLNQVMGLSLSAQEVSSLETRTEGWIAGLQLAALALQGTLAMRGREDVPGFISAFAGDNRYIVDYLVQEVLLRQPERVRSFLLQTSILDRLSGPLCDAVRFGGAKSPSSSGRTAVRFGFSKSSSSSTGTASRFGVAEEPSRSGGEASSERTAKRFDFTRSPTGQEDGREMLEALERGNLFVVALDDKRLWYRYHHLFADVLQARSMKELSNQLPVLHRRASEWYEQQDLPSDAIRHALAAEDFERAADLAELAWPAMSGSFQSIAWLGWLTALPDELVRARPVLSVGYAWAYLNAGKLEAAEARLLDAERWLEPTTDTSERPAALSTETCPEQSRRMVVVDEEQFRSLPTSLAAARAYHAQALGDLPATVKYARRVLDLIPEGDPQWRGDVTALLALAYWASGDLEAAHRTFSDGLAGMNIGDLIVGTFVLADIKMTLGRLREAVSTYENSLQLAAGMGEPMPLGTEDLYTGISKLHRERGDLEAAAQDLRTSRKLGEQVELPDWQYRWCIAQARLRVTLGDPDGALDLLDEAQRVFVRTPLPDVCPIAALKARVWAAQGRLTEALDWAREQRLSVNNDLSYLHEFEHVTLARVLIAAYKNNRADSSILDAIGLLERLLKAAEEGHRTGSVIEILVLQALACQSLGDIPCALDPLGRALTLAEPQGYVRIFVDEGFPMAQLLSAAAAHGIMPDYVGKLLAAFEAEAQKNKGRSYLPPAPPAQPLIEPLSHRELEVLQLIAAGLTNPEIASRLFVSLNTVKTHTRNIYGKLAVHSRTQAIARSQELGILQRSRP